jgi:hypothetical protein
VLLPALTSRGRTVRKWRKQTSFSGGPLVHELVIPAGPDGRPGERLMAASRSLYAPRTVADGSREDFRVLVDRHGSTFASVCLRRVDPGEQVEECAWNSLKHHLKLGSESTYEVTRTRIAGEQAFGYSVVLRSGVLTDWKLAHAGWLFVVGTLNWAPPAEREATIERTLAALDTWQWL